jgi:hypothetical protein
MIRCCACNKIHFIENIKDFFIDLWCFFKRDVIYALLIKWFFKHNVQLTVDLELYTQILAWVKENKMYRKVLTTINILELEADGNAIILVDFCFRFPEDASYFKLTWS